MVRVRERKIQDVWSKVDAINAERGFAQQEPGFTVMEYAKRYGLSRLGAHCRLRKLVDEGKLVAGFRLERGVRLRVYRLPE